MMDALIPGLSVVAGMSPVDMPAYGFPANGLFLAEGDIVQLIIWVVIFAFYGLAQLLQKGKKRGRQPGQPRSRPVTSSPKDELREFLESLATSTEAEEESVLELPPEQEPTVLPPPTPPPVFTRERQFVQPPRPEPPPRPAAKIVVPQGNTTQPSERWATEALREDAKHYTHSTVSAKAFMVSTKGQKMPSVNLRTARSPHSNQVSATKPSLRGTRALKQAMVHHILLSPPRGLKEDWIFSS